jgi:integrase
LPVNPFDKFTVGTYEASDKEPLSAEDITKLWNYKPVNPSEKLARDTFLFSYYAAGMRSSDVLLLEWDEITPRYIIYTQGKKEHRGGAKLRIPMNSFLDTIIKGYEQGTETIFDVVPARTDKNFLDVKRKIESKQAVINRYLKLIAQKVGITKHIMFKLARTTFADIANKKTNRDIYGIQQSLGHSKISTTEIYLGKDQSAIDELLKKVYS